MEFDVTYMPDAVETLETYDEETAKRIFEKISWLSEHFDHITPESLTGDLKGFYKLRIGDYRVIYTFSKKEREITVHRIGHRKDIYR